MRWRAPCPRKNPHRMAVSITAAPWHPPRCGIHERAATPYETAMLHMNIRIAVSTLVIGATAVLLYAADQKPASPTGNQVKRAAAQLAPTAGQKVKGSVAFTKEGGKLHVVGDVVGLEPGSKHGFHIHEFGDCSAPDASTAGDHFAPKAEPHGSPTTPPHHAGDLG